MKIKIKGVFKKSQIPAIALLLILGIHAQATVFINEVFINPPGSATDDSREFIELMGTPSMKLDGYAVAVLNGTEVKYYFPAGSIPPLPDGETGPEIDEFFSLDGLTLGKNGLLALLISDKTPGYFPGVLSDSNWVNWNGLWNGGLDVPGKIGNNGSQTILLLRNRPGITEANPTDPKGLLWGKEINHDVFLDTPVWDDSTSQWADQWGDGSIDRGDSDGMGGNSLDLSGLTFSGLGNDLEIVDEVSYEDDAGWEYDTDGRHVDNGNSEPNFPSRHVHALDNPIGFNPDVLTRVDYRTKGIGWTPSGDGTGEMANGNNWQDTATEQWIRGDSVAHTINFVQHYFYDNSANPLNTIQPFQTNVPLWLDDGIGQDYDFSPTNDTYEISAGRCNPLAVAFIPGDTDRDGDCDPEDIAKTAAVFGNDDWIFSNSFYDAPEGDGHSGDPPPEQTRPWDVDLTGDNGIEASDLQWVLNFQGDTTGQIVGIQYDSTTPAATGVVLNSNAGTECTLTTSVYIPSGRTLSTLIVDDMVEITVRGEVTAGANTTTGEQNGIMQYVHDLSISSGGVVKVISVEPLGSFDMTRASLQQKLGTDGDLGMALINGYTRSFTEGLFGRAALYRITLEAVCTGSVDVTIAAAGAAKFLASTPAGLKIGHTDSNGNPASSIPASPLSLTSSAPPGDFDDDGDEDAADLMIFMAAWLSNDSPTDNWNPACDLSNPHGLIDMGDFRVFAEYWLKGCGN